MSRLVRVTAVAAVAAAAFLPLAPASACHQPVAPIGAHTPWGYVELFPGITIPC